MARKLRFFKEQVDKSGVTITAPISEEDKVVQFDELEVRKSALHGCMFTAWMHGLISLNMRSDSVQCALWLWNIA